MSYDTGKVRSDVLKIVARIASLSEEVFDNITYQKDCFTAANELVKNAAVLTFALGELHALNVTSPSVVQPNQSVVTSKSNYHNLRDSRGRFVKASYVNVSANKVTVFAPNGIAVSSPA